MLNVEQVNKFLELCNELGYQISKVKNNERKVQIILATPGTTKFDEIPFINDIRVVDIINLIKDSQVFQDTESLPEYNGRAILFHAEVPYELEILKNID